jgi:hypothetical protein
MNKCCHTLFSSVLLHYCILIWIHPHESSLNSTFDYVQDLYHYIVPWRTSPFQSFDHATQALKIHISQSTILLPYLSYHSILINPKCKTNPFQLFVCCLCLDCIVCLFVCNISCLDCEEELNYKCDCCECAGCFQGKW